MYKTNTTILMGISAFALSLTMACGGDEEAAKPEAPAATAAKTAEPAAELKPWTDALSDADIVKYGEQIFLSPGSNTCNDCHGKDGKKGRLEQAANLTDPASWRSTRALDGNQAAIDTALTYLLSNGGKAFNDNFAKDNPDISYDWSKADAEAYDIQMFGVTQSATQAVIKKIRKSLKKEGIALEKADLVKFGAKAAYAYVKTLAGGGDAGGEEAAGDAAPADNAAE